MKKKLNIVMFFLLVSVGTTGWYVWKEFNRSHTETAMLKPAFTYDAVTLLNEFEKDESKANAKMNDKVIAVKGNISKIEINDSTQTVLLGVDESLGAVLCQFDASHRDEVTKLKVSDVVIIKGVCTGILIDVILARCALDKPAARGKD